MSPGRPPRAPALRYRPARRTDVENLAQLGVIVYRVASLEKRREYYTDHPRFGLRDVRVGELDGQLVGSMVLLPLTAFVRGSRIGVTGVGSVAVSPEHRRRGVGEALMRSALREMRQNASAFSMLYAFRTSYYRKLGYGISEVVDKLAFSPSNLPHSDEARRVRRLMLPDRPAVQSLYDRVAMQGHFAIDRKPEWWSQRLWTYPGDWVVYEGKRRGQIEGYLHYEVDSSDGPFDLAITLKEVVAATPEAHRGLVGYLASQRDQVKEIQYAAPGDHAWLGLLETAQNLRPGADMGLITDAGGLGAGAMLRVNDVKLALELLPVSPAARGEVVIEVEDAVLTPNSRAYRVSAREGRLKVSTGDGRARTPRAARPPRLRVGAEALGPLVAGTLSPMRAAELGLIESSGGGAEAIENWFRARPVFLYGLNAF